MNEQVVSEECLRAAKFELNERGGSNAERLAKVLCILLEGVVDTLLEEYIPEDGT